MIYQRLKPLLFQIDPEQIHEHTVQALHLAQHTPPARLALETLFHFEHPALAIECAGLSFLNPFGMAAGFDKRAELVPGLAALGFGHVETGTVTPMPQPGNDRPRMFRLPEDQALINRMGFNSPGVAVAAENLQRNQQRGIAQARVGVNIGKNKLTPLEDATADYVRAFDHLAPLGDYVAVNISSPNTPGLRQLHERSALMELLGGLAERNRALSQPRPIFVKVSPDETPAQLDDVVEAVRSTGLAGFIAGNTTLDRQGLRGGAAGETGGLSGAPLTTRSRAIIAHLHQATDGTLPVIGVGGVMNADDAYGHMLAGATLVQVYTGLIYNGPGFVKALKRGLLALLERDGFRTVAQAVGAGVR